MTLYEHIGKLIKQGNELGDIAKRAVKSYDETGEESYLDVAEKRSRNTKKYKITILN